MSKQATRKGDRVRFQLAFRFIEGVVKEDRGPIGVGGRHLYLVEFHYEDPTLLPAEVELPAVEFELVEAAASKR